LNKNNIDAPKKVVEPPKNKKKKKEPPFIIPDWAKELKSLIDKVKVILIILSRHKN
jgi:hypothetical protein